MSNNGFALYQVNGPRIRANVLKFTSSLEAPLDPNELVGEFSKILLPQPLTTEQLDNLKEILIPGLPDFEWTVEYGKYLQDPQNSELANAIETRLRLLLKTILTMADFQLG